MIKAINKALQVPIIITFVGGKGLDSGELIAELPEALVERAQ